MHLHDARPEVEGEERRRVRLLFPDAPVAEQLLPAPHRLLRLGRLRRRLGHRLHVQEDGLLAEAVVALGADHVLAAVGEFDAVDDERVVVAGVAPHVLDRLSQLQVVAVPGDGRRRQRDHAAREAHRLALVGERRGGPDDEPRSRLQPVEGDLVHPVALHLHLAQTGVVGDVPDRHQELVPRVVARPHPVTQPRVA